MRGAARQKSLDSPQFEVRNLQRIDRGRRIIACLDFVLRGVTLRKSRLIDGISGVYACGPALRARSDAWAATLAELESDLALECKPPLKRSSPRARHEFGREGLGPALDALRDA